jgi:hypothetical protein
MMTAVWLHYWHERCILAERSAAEMAEPLHRCLMLQHCRYSEEDAGLIIRWSMLPPREQNPYGTTDLWSERAGNAEMDADRLAALLRSCSNAGWWTHEALQRYEERRSRRYRPLPVGPTLQGNLASGGWEV